MKDHEIAALVNELVVTAQTFHMAGQLRERMRAIVHDPLKRISDLEIECATLRHGLRLADRRADDGNNLPADLVRRLLADHQRVEPHHADLCQLCREATAAIDGQPVPTWTPAQIDQMHQEAEAMRGKFKPGRVADAPAQGERQPSGCSLCGSTGLHACPGGKVEWTPEKIEEFRVALDKYPQQKDMLDGDR